MSSRTLQASALAAFISLAVPLDAQAAITLTLTPNTTLGGTDFTFSGGSGAIGSSAGSNFLVGERIASPLGFAGGPNTADVSLSVLAGTNSFGIARIFAPYYYSGLAGTAGPIAFGLDFQGSGSWRGRQVSEFNGLTLNADAIPYARFVPGTYVLPSYYSGYFVDLGTFTLQVGTQLATVPEPMSLAIMGIGIAGLLCTGRTKRREA